MMKVDLEDVTSRQVRRNNIYFDTIESFSLFSLVNILGSRLDYFLFLPCPFHTILDLLMFSFIFSPFSLFFQPRLIPFFLFHLLQHHPPNVAVLSLHPIHSFPFYSLPFPLSFLSNPLFVYLFPICLLLHYTPLPIFLALHTSCFLSKSLIILLTSNPLLIIYCLYHLRIICLHPSLSLSSIVLL